MNLTLQRLKKLKVLLAVPSTGVWNSEFGMSLCMLALAFNQAKVGGYKEQTLKILHMKGSILPNLRWDAVREAKAQEADYLLFIDSDQTFPRSLLHALISRDKDVIAANIATKQIPASPTARARSSTIPHGVPVFTDPESTGVEKVWRVGCGIMLISKRAFERLGPGAFAMPYREEWDKYQGEDWSLCSEFERLGFDVWIDHDVSKHVGHVGYYTYNHDVVGQVVQRHEGRAA